MGDHQLEVQLLSDFQTPFDQPDFKSDVSFKIKKIALEGTSNGGAYECKICPIGQVSSGWKSYCSYCPVGKQAKSDGSKCIICPEGEYND